MTRKNQIKISLLWDDIDLMKKACESFSETYSGTMLDAVLGLGWLGFKAIHWHMAKIYAKQQLTSEMKVRGGKTSGETV
ncbi:hypothetical protein F2Q69_00032975 [Brassica cretica]|uniref:Uncharacterized protein n=1 Tax=Brassica cretica TaxID=69181 RepID=A0A8S9SLK5_BRACR|nr:hypothetical protein F2Q69_00032975 [Brassica cretica]